MRFLVDVPDDDVKWLDAHAREQGKSRAAILRDAVAAYRAEAGQDWLDQAFGVWKDRRDVADGVAFQRHLRAE